MKVQEKFNNVFSYAAGLEKWVKDCYEQMSGKKLKYTFPADFAIADWYGEDSVKETYERVKKAWIGDYKAFTEVCVSLVYLSYANEQLKKQGLEDRDKFIALYVDLYYQVMDDFYEKYTENREACDWFFEWTD